MTRSIHLQFEEILIDHNRLPFKGRLLVATPSRSRPRSKPAAEWCIDLAEMILDHYQYQWVIPASFWSKGQSPWQGSMSKELPRYIALPDFCDHDQYEFDLSPRYALQEMIDMLSDGEDVVVLNATKQPSVFTHIAIHYLQEPYRSIEKVLCWQRSTNRYGLTLPQRAYLLGLEQSQRVADNAKCGGYCSSVEDLSAMFSKEPIGQLEKDIHWTQDQLQSLAGELFHEIAPELMDIAHFLSECEEYPGVDTTIGAMASITYRLCDVFKDVAEIGLEALDVAEGERGEIPDYQLGSRLAQLRSGHGLIAERLARLYDSALCFIPCDLDVLLGHPEIANAKHLQQTIKLIADQIEKIFGRLDDMRVTALNINHAGPVEPVPRKTDRDWKAVQALLETCLQTCREKTETEPPCWVNKPTQHPKHGESGNIVTIKHPTKPSAADTWHSNSRTAIFVPGGKAPKTLNAVPVHAWRDHPRQSDDWNASDLLMPSLNELPPPKHPLPLASGVVAVEPDGRIWMVSPTNKFGGYETTFPKGKLDHAGLSLQANAIKEGYEESGLQVRITGYLGDFKRSTSITRLYLAERVGGDPTGMGWESQAVRLVPPAEWGKHLENPADQPVLAALRKHFGIEG